MAIGKRCCGGDVDGARVVHGGCVVANKCRRFLILIGAAAEQAQGCSCCQLAAATAAATVVVVIIIVCP